MDRRTFLTAATGSAAVLAGCAASPGSDEGPESNETPSGDPEEDETGTDDETDEDQGEESSPTNTPEEAVEQYFAALSEGDREQRKAVLHSENPELEELAEMSDEELAAAADRGDIEVVETRMIESDDETTVLEVTVSMTTEEGTARATDGLELAVEDDRWKIKGQTDIDYTGEVSDPIPEDPEGVISQFVTAVDVTDTERMAALIHGDSPLADAAPYDAEYYSKVDATVEETALVEESDEEAVVEATVTTTYEGESLTETRQYLLRREDGAWRFWDYAENVREIEEPIPEDPIPIVEQYFAALSIGDTDRIVALEHPESPGGTDPETDAAEFEDVEFTVEEATVLSESAEEVVVEVTVTVAFAGMGEGTNTDEITLRPQDGEWRIWVEEQTDESGN